jgi:hypothetical protein
LVDAFCQSQSLEPPRQRWADALRPYPQPAAPAQPDSPELGDRFMEILRAIHGDMPDDFADSARLAFVHALKETAPEPNQWPIAKLSIDESGLPTASLYAPGLPTGEFDVYLSDNYAAPAQPEPDYCKTCGGSGSIPGIDGSGPDAYTLDVECHACGGTGDDTPPAPKPLTLSDEQIDAIPFEGWGFSGEKEALRAFARAVLAAAEQKP